MSRDNISESGVRFTSEYQPSPEAKSVPKHRTWLKKVIRENREVFETMVKKGHKDFWKLAMEYAHSKAPENKNITITGYSEKVKEKLKDIENEL